MKAQVKDRIRIVNKMNDWSMEYQEGDVFTVESTWYGGVNVTSKTGVPISLDEVEYEVISQEENTVSSQEKENKIAFHADTEEGLLRALKAAAEMESFWQGENTKGKIVIVAEDRAVYACQNKEETDVQLEDLKKTGVRVQVCRKSMEQYQIEGRELAQGGEIIAWGIQELVKLQGEGWAYIKL